MLWQSKAEKKKKQVKILELYPLWRPACFLIRTSCPLQCYLWNIF